MTTPPTPPTDNLAAEGGPRSEMSELRRLEELAGAANESELRWLLGEWLTELTAPEREVDPLTAAAAWVADGIGYPVQVQMPDHPMPQGLWDALVAHVHADESGKWHGNTLNREDTESWLADEAGRTSR